MGLATDLRRHKTLGTPEGHLWRKYRATGCCELVLLKTLNDRTSRVKLIASEIIYPHRLGAQFHFLLLDRIVRFVPFDNAPSSHNVPRPSPDLRTLIGKGHSFGPKYPV